MKITISKKSEQVSGSFPYGAILEKKPIGFPQEGGKIKAYSNLLYWAHAWSDNGGLIDEHPHKGFEIVSYVLNGEIEHYDSKLKGWKKLIAGDFQVIRSGNGITHAEKILKDSAIFQIWFDPDLRKSMQKEATYNDYKDSEFPVVENGSYNKKIILGDKSPVKMETEGISIAKYELKNASNVSIKADKNKIYSFFLIEGELEVSKYKIEKGDFVILKEVDNLEIQTSSKSTIFMIENPLKPSYKLYIDNF